VGGPSSRLLCVLANCDEPLLSCYYVSQCNADISGTYRTCNGRSTSGRVHLCYEALNHPIPEQNWPKGSTSNTGGTVPDPFTAARSKRIGIERHDDDTSRGLYGVFDTINKIFDEAIYGALYVYTDTFCLRG
jgi:hypothetical protein